MTRVSACVATRGDVDMKPILDSLPEEWEIIVWNNGERRVEVRRPGARFRALLQGSIDDLGPHGRFAAIHVATHELIYVQDDDVIVSDPQVITDHYEGCLWHTDGVTMNHGVVANMPQEFRPHYPDSCMVGFGAAFHRDAPELAFRRFFAAHPEMGRRDPLFLRESCRVFTTLTERVLVDIPKTDLPYASDDNRLWKQPDHVGARERILTLAREAR